MISILTIIICISAIMHLITIIRCKRKYSACLYDRKATLKKHCILFFESAPTVFSLLLLSLLLLWVISQLKAWKNRLQQSWNVSWKALNITHWCNMLQMCHMVEKEPWVWAKMYRGEKRSEGRLLLTWSCKPSETLTCNTHSHTIIYTYAEDLSNCCCLAFC